MISRRAFIAALPLIASACAVKRQAAPATAIIHGHVLRPGLRFGRITFIHTDGRYTTHVRVPGVKVALWKFEEKTVHILWQSVASSTTDDRGYFKFNNLPNGTYLIKVPDTLVELVNVTQPRAFYRTLIR